MVRMARDDGMIGVAEALARVMGDIAPLAAEAVPLLDALGRVLAADVVAGEDIPPFRNSAMDGYAVRAVDLAGAMSSLRRTNSMNRWAYAFQVWACECKALA